MQHFEITEGTANTFREVAASGSKAVSDSVIGLKNGEIIWPTGGFSWSEKWTAMLPVVRGIHVPPRPPEFSLQPGLIVFPKDEGNYYQQDLTSFGNTLGRTWIYWDEQESSQRITRTALRVADFEYWLELMAQNIAAHGIHTNWIVSTGIALHGLPFMLEIMLTFCFKDNSRVLSKNFLLGLRYEIASVDDVQYQLAYELAARLREGNDEKKAVCAYLFPHIEAWLLDVIFLQKTMLSLLQSCVMPLAAAVSVIEENLPAALYRYEMLLLQIKLHGEQLFPLLKKIFLTSTRSDYAPNLELFLAMRVPQMIDVLFNWLENKDVRKALNTLATQFPLAALKAAIEQRRSRSIELWMARLILRKPELPACLLSMLDAPQRAKFQTFLAELDRPGASAEQLPALLRNPPWQQKNRQQELPVLAITPIPTAERIEWKSEQTERYVAYYRYEIENSPAQKMGREIYLLNKLFIREQAHAGILAGAPLLAADVIPLAERHDGVFGDIYDWPHYVLFLPQQIGLTIWNSFPWQRNATHSSYGDDDLRAILSQFGSAAIPGLLNFMGAFTEKGLRCAIKVDSPKIVPTVLHVLRNTKRNQVAIDWITAYPVTTLMAALPLAFGADDIARQNAQFCVRWMWDNGFTSQVEQAANTYGCAMVDALLALREQDPLAILPARLPNMPSFFVPAAFRRPQLKNGEFIAPDSATHIGIMLAMSKLDSHYAGLDMLRDLCTADSLGAFAWDIFEAWLDDGAPSKESWVFVGLSVFGNDEIARCLAPKIREWSDQAMHVRAALGLDLLAAIGSDIALMHVNGIATKMKFKRLQGRAQEKIAAIAEARGLTLDELQDRLVPDLDLDGDASLELDFGLRKFYVSFDETLMPFVKDAAGMRLKNLPKPIKSDDAGLSKIAVERFKQLKKDAKAIAGLQVMRMERSMVARRRWSSADFILLFLEHPVMRHLAARVVWGVYADDALKQSFRIAEDWTFTDDRDESFLLPDRATIGLVHVLEMPASSLAAFGQIFADYEILQPFKQLGRETFALRKEEENLAVLNRYANKQVASGSIMGLMNRGWEPGAPQDSGWVQWFSKPYGTDLRVELTLDPGILVGEPSYEAKQKLPTLTLCKAYTWEMSGEDLVPFSRLDPILLSEILRDIELLSPLAE